MTVCFNDVATSTDFTQDLHYVFKLFNSSIAKRQSPITVLVLYDAGTLIKVFVCNGSIVSFPQNSIISMP